MLPVTKRRDARSLPHDVLEEMRRLSVQRALAGETHAEIGRSIDIHPNTVSKWVRAWTASGDEGIASTKAPGPPTKLTDVQLAKLRRIIVGKNPRQLNFGSALWTLPIIEDVIEKLFRVRLHKTTVWRLLHRMGLKETHPEVDEFATP